MLLKDKSVTISSKSTTNNQGSLGIDTPIQFVKGVGPKLGAIFQSRQISTVKDLLFFFPRAYEDRSQFVSVNQLEEGMKATLKVKVLSQKRVSIQKLGRSLLEVHCSDDTGILNLKWFYSPKGMEKKFVPGASFVVTGRIKIYSGTPEIVHPEVTTGAMEEGNAADPHLHVGRIVPIYTEIEGVPSRTLRKVLWEALDKFGHSIQEDVPFYLLERRDLPRLAEGVRALHFPSETKKEAQKELSLLEDFATPAHQRLIYGEFFKFEYLILRQRLNIERTQAPQFSHRKGKTALFSLMQTFPFQLTAGQKQALEDILGDFALPHPMNRLVQGDVGSGKTAIAFLSSAYVLAEGAQACLMAPTEILAEQHYKNASKLFKGELNVALLTGKSSALERQNLQTKLSNGEPLLVIGTHALLEDSVIFSNLSYVIVDEQHRFGVEQRRILRRKGTKGSKKEGNLVLPHLLVLTATPIPRTLALTAFGDLSVTSIRDLPPGRSPILTRVVKERGHKTRVHAQIKKELASGRQAYFIYPLVNDSEAEGFTQLKSAVAEAEVLKNEVFPEFRVGLLHGQMRPEEKAAVMDRFQQGMIQILVSTTVVEVGVDVPNATVMAIEHSERFGLSQLHQLRGRVGRGKFQSYCYLFSSIKGSQATNARLEVLEESNDGFKIAEADLEIRGPGEFLGTRQAGALPFHLANLVRDQEWLIKARDDAMDVLSQDRDLLRPEHECLKRYFHREGGVQVDRLNS